MKDQADFYEEPEIICPQTENDSCSTHTLSTSSAYPFPIPTFNNSQKGHLPCCYSLSLLHLFPGPWNQSPRKTHKTRDFSSCISHTNHKNLDENQLNIFGRFNFHKICSENKPNFLHFSFHSLLDSINFRPYLLAHLLKFVLNIFRAKYLEKQFHIFSNGI